MVDILVTKGLIDVCRRLQSGCWWHPTALCKRASGVAICSKPREFTPRGRGYHYPTRPKKLIQHYPSFAADERKDNVEHEISEEMRRKNSTQNESRNDAAQTLPVMRQRKYH